MLSNSFDRDLIRRRNIQGPRYTSYPTADRLREGSWTETYRSTLAATRPQAISLYLHIPFCSTICFYCGCNKVHTANLKRADSYVQRVKCELAMYSRLIDTPHKIEQLHFGGGTPTFLSDGQFCELFETIGSYFDVDEKSARDFSIEVDPRRIGSERIENLARLGINRMSVGVQDFDPAVQLAINRIQSIEETKNVIDTARLNAIRSINIDLIYGLPKQTTDGFRKTLEQVIKLNPDRLALYSYAHLPHRFKSQRQIDPRDLPDADQKLQLLGMSVDVLSQAGYEYVGMDHFARSTDTLIKARDQKRLHRNFQGYTTHGHCEQIGIGVSAIGKVGNLYVQNAKALHSYYQLIDRGELPLASGLPVSENDALVGQVIQDLMCKLEIDYASFFESAGIEFSDRFSLQWSTLMEFEKDGLIELTADKLIVTDRGRFLLRNICMTFDSYLPENSDQFSKAI